MISDFISQNMKWLWQFPVNGFIIWLGTTPNWVKYSAIVMIACDLVRLGMEIQKTEW